MSALRKNATAVLLAGAVLAAGCADGGVFAPRAPQLQRAVLSLAGANAGGDAAAFDRATAIQVRLTRSGATILDSVLAFTPAAETRVPIEVEIASSPETLGVEVELRAGASPVFRANGTATMKRGETTSLTLALVPVASALRVGSLPTLTAIGESAQATGAVVFSTGDTIHGVTVTWTSATPAIVSVTGDGRVTATGEGQGQVIASGGGFTQTVPVTVSATVSSVTLSPRSPTVQVGGSVVFSALAKDRNGNVLARTITFSSSNQAVAPINATGTATAVMAGTTQIAAAVGSVRDTTTLTVTNPPPPTPTNLVATAVSATQVNLSWTDNSNLENGFRIERCTGQGCSNFAEIGTVGANVTGYQDGGLTGATSYTYRIRAFNSTGTSAYSNPATVTTQPLLPAAPSNLAATAVSSSQINLGWSDNANNEDGFRIERCTGQGCSNFAEIAALGANATSYQNGGLAEGTTYTYRVRAFNGNGSSGYSNTASATTTLTLPAAPTNLTATAVSSTQINLAWVDNATNENAYLIERCTGAQCTSFQQITTGGANATAYQDLALAGGTTYGYRLRAYNAAGYSAYSNVAYATTQPTPTIPNPPTGLTATAVSSSQINLLWTDASNNETGFRIERCQGAGCSSGFTEIGTASANATSFGSTGLAALTIYGYRVRSYNEVGTSAYSNIAYDTTFAVVTIPNPPTGLTATAVSSSQINLLWTDASNNETGFRIEMCTSSGCPTFSEIATVGANVNSYARTGLSALTPYGFRVRAYNGAGNSAYSNTAYDTTFADVSTPAPPTLTATGINSGTIELRVTDNSTNETGWRLEHCAGSGCTSFTLLGTITSSSVGSTGSWYTDWNVPLSPSTTHRYRAYAYNGAGNSAYTTIQTASTLVAETVVPAQPTGLGTTTVSTTAISLRWTLGATNVVGYRFEHCKGVSCSDFTEFRTDYPYALVGIWDSNLLPGTSYRYRIRSFNAAGNSTYSAIATGVTLDGTGGPNAPSGLFVSFNPLNGTTTVTWTDNSTVELGFRVERCIGTSTCTAFSEIAVTGPNITTYQESIPVIQCNRYRVRAYNAGGNSAYSNAYAVCG